MNYNCLVGVRKGANENPCEIRDIFMWEANVTYK